LKEDKYLLILACISIISISGCLYGTTHEEQLTIRKKEKTKQMIIQASMDTLNYYLEYNKSKYSKTDGKKIN